MVTTGLNGMTQAALKAAAAMNLVTINAAGTSSALS